MTTSQASAPEAAKPTFHDPKELRRRRRLSGLSQKQVAIQAQISGAHLCNLEKGKADASPPTLLRIVEVIGCTMADVEMKSS